MQREIRCGGEFGFDDDRVHVSNWAGRAVPQLPLLNFRREGGGCCAHRRGRPGGHGRA